MHSAGLGVFNRLPVPTATIILTSLTSFFTDSIAPGKIAPSLIPNKDRHLLSMIGHPASRIVIPVIYARWEEYQLRPALPATISRSHLEATITCPSRVREPVALSCHFSPTTNAMGTFSRGLPYVSAWTLSVSSIWIHVRYRSPSSGEAGKKRIAKSLYEGCIC